jgi:ferric-dicitrate binding protein FerR (iron transport regulator)
MNMEENNYKPLDMDDLLVRYLIDSVSDDEKVRIDNWLAESSDNRKHFDNLKDIYHLGKVTKTPSGYDKDKSLERVRSRYYRYKYEEVSGRKGTAQRRPSILAAVSVAATILVAFGLGFYLHSVVVKQPAQSSEVIYNEVSSPAGSRSQAVLPDGTRVWLNAGSKIRYPMEFLNGDRQVTLSGEAYFEVSKMKDKRFIVKAGDLAIRVWGTKFNVKAYPEENTIQTTLVEGSVSILNTKEIKPRETYLQPKQTATYYKDPANEEKIPEPQKPSKAPEPVQDSELQVQDKINTVLYTSWKDEKWIIEGKTLGQFAVEMERRYNVKIDFENDYIRNYRFNGIFRDETFEQMLQVIKLSSPVDFSINYNNILIKEDSNIRKSYDKYLRR